MDGINATYLSSTSFKLLGNRTAEFVPYRRVKAYCGSEGTVYSDVESSSYDSQEDVTTVHIFDPVLTEYLREVWFGVVSPSPNQGTFPYRGVKDYFFAWKQNISTESVWQASTNYSTGDKVRPTTKNGYYYEVTNGDGTSGDTEPEWPTTPNATITDGGVTWTCKIHFTLSAFDNVILDDGVSALLPESPQPGDRINFAVGGDWETNNSYLYPNGEKIMKVAEDLVLNSNSGFALVYQDVNRGWVFS